MTSNLEIASSSEAHERTSLIESGHAKPLSNGEESEDTSKDNRRSLRESSDIKKQDDIDNFTSWIRLLVFFVAAVVAGGIIPGQNVYNRLFCEAGLFRYACADADANLDVDINSSTSMTSQSPSCCPSQWLIIADVMNVLSMSVTLLFMLSGLLFDMLGGQKVATLGCLLLFCGTNILALEFTFLANPQHTISPLMETTVFVIGVILADAGSALANVGFFGFLWHLPHHQAFVLSLSNACFAAASMIPLLISVFITHTSLSLSTTLAMYSAMLLIAGGTSWITVPNMEEYRSQALKVLGLPIPKRSIKGLKGAIKQLRNACRILPRHATLHSMTIGATVLSWISPFIYMSMSDPLGQEIFGSEESGHKMGNMFVQVNTIIGLIIGPTCAVLIDNANHASEGLLEVAIGIAVSMAILAVLCGVPMWSIQITSLSVASACQTIVLLFITRYAVIFAPPQKVGTFSGLLVAIFGLASLLPIILVSVAISINGSYVRPTAIASTIGSIAWVFYIIFLRNTKPWPRFPVLLPEDEKEISKMFSVGTLDEAAFVVGLSTEEFLKLQMSNKVEHQRRLSDSAMSQEAAEKVLHVARRRSSLMSTAPAYSREDYPIPNFAQTVGYGSAITSADTACISFNGHGHFGGNNEPSVEWMLNPLGPPDTPERVEAIDSFIRPVVVCAERYGLLLEIADLDNNGQTVTAAVCGCYPPGGLEKDGSATSQTGGRWFYGLAHANVAPFYINKNISGGETTVQRLTAFKQDSRWDEHREEYGTMWYVGVLATHPAYQGKGYGRLLLDVVAYWADQTDHDCYLECSIGNVPFYKKCGYIEIWRTEISVEGSSTTMVGMARKAGSNV